jgi:hypothetical protein
MARQEMLMARCDRKECKTVVEISRDTVAPEGWLQIAVEIEGKWDSVSRMEFCSEKCVSIWAKSRGKVVNPRPNGNAPNYRDDIVSAIQVLYENNEEQFTSKKVAEIAEMNDSTVATWMKKLADENIIKHVRGEGKKGDPLVYEAVK